MSIDAKNSASMTPDRNRTDASRVQAAAHELLVSKRSARRRLVVRAAVYGVVLALLALLLACSGYTECLDSGYACRERGNWQVCTARNAGGYCLSRYYIAPDGTQIDCNGCDCNQTVLARDLYCAGVTGDPGVSDASPEAAPDAPDTGGGDASDAGGGDASDAGGGDASDAGGRDASDAGDAPSDG
jgi:hypothetical protein